MTRWKASSIHLAISVIIALAVSTLMLMIWYPHPLFEAVGGQQVLTILLAVDIVLGPIITLMIFDLKKKTLRALKFDLAVIAFVQISALLYGMNVVFESRPAYIVFKEDSFYLITANNLSDEDLEQASHPDFRSPPLSGPLYAYTEFPNNPDDMQKIITSELNGKGLSQLPQYYKPFDEHKADAGRAAIFLTELKKTNPEQASELDEVAHESGRAEKDIGYLPLRAKAKDLTVLIGKPDGEILAILDTNQ